MPKLQRKNLSFQAGELSPRFFGRSDTEIYAKGLAVAENVFIDKRGGAFKRGGLLHVGRIDANNARLFTLQVSRTRYYTVVIFYDLILDKGRMLLIAPGASLIGFNLLDNGNFANSSANWNSAVEPASSQVVFSVGDVVLRPEQNNLERVINGGFQQQGLNWIVRESHAQSSVTFSVGSVLLQPRQTGSQFAGIAQELTTGHVGSVHTIAVTGDFGAGEVTVKVGTVEADGTYLDTVVNELTSGQTIDFTPAASPFFITVDCVNPSVFANISNISVQELIVKTAAVSQEATVIASETEEHIVIVGQSGGVELHVLIGTTDGASDIAEFDSTDHEIVGLFIPNNPTYWVTVLADGDDIQEAQVNFIGTAARAASTPLGFFMDAPWTESQLDEIHFIQVPSGKTLYFTQPNVPVQKLIYDSGSDTFVPLQAVSFINPPSQWAGENHPATGTHFQGRMWLAGTPGEAQTIWGSKSGAVEDFTVVADEDSSSMEFTLQDFGRIEWMLGTKNLLIGAENGEHIVDSEGGVIVPTDFKIQKQSSFGSNNMQGIQVGEKVFYLTPDGRKLRSMSYDWQEDNWLSQDLTFASEHITQGIGKHGVWSQNPEGIFALILEDGTIAAVTYDRTADTLAWTRYSIPGVNVKDIATGRDSGINEIVAAGQRVAGKIDIEAGAVAPLVKLDSFVSLFDAGGTNIITGLDHLEGLTVRPIVDGAVQPLEVVVGGQITTQDTGLVLAAGMPYTAKIVTLPPDVPQDQIRSWKKRWNKVWALMFNSKPPIINGVRPPERTPSTPMNTVEPNVSGHYKTVNLGWDDNGQITIEEDLPVAMNVLAIYGEMGTESID